MHRREDLARLHGIAEPLRKRLDDSGIPRPHLDDALGVELHLPGGLHRDLHGAGTGAPHLDLGAPHGLGVQLDPPFLLRVRPVDGSARPREADECLERVRLVHDSRAAQVLTFGLEVDRVATPAEPREHDGQPLASGPEGLLRCV